MGQKIQMALAVSALTSAGVAIAAYTYARALPYRLTPMEDQLLGVAVGTQVITSFLVVVIGNVAVIAGRHQTHSGRRLGVAAIILGALALLLALVTVHIHSISFKLSGNDILELEARLTDAHLAISVAQLNRREAWGGGRLMWAQRSPQYGRSFTWAGFFCSGAGLRSVCVLSTRNSLWCYLHGLGRLGLSPCVWVS